MNIGTCCRKVNKSSLHLKHFVTKSGNISGLQIVFEVNTKKSNSWKFRESFSVCSRMTQRWVNICCYFESDWTSTKATPNMMYGLFTLYLRIRSTSMGAQTMVRHQFGNFGNKRHWVFSINSKVVEDDESIEPLKRCCCKLCGLKSTRAKTMNNECKWQSLVLKLFHRPNPSGKYHDFFMVSTLAAHPLVQIFTDYHLS